MNKLLLLFILFTSCFQLESGKGHQRKPDSILIVYLSRTNNTKAVAEIIQQNVGGDLVALELRYPYPKEYNAIVKQVAEENASGFLPPLKTKVNMAQYDTIFLGFPTWGMQLPPPIKSFLYVNDWKGKTVIPFNTHAGYGVGSGFRQVKEVCKDCKVLNGLSLKGGIERDGIYLAIKGVRAKEVEKEVNGWLIELNLVERD